MDKLTAWIIGLVIVFVCAMIADCFIERHLDKIYGPRDEM